MRKSIMVLAGVLTACMLSACEQPKGTLQATSQGPGAANSVTLAKPVMSMALPAGAKVYEKDGMFTIVDAQGTHAFYIWQISGASTLDEAAERAGETIRSEFLDFKLKSKKDLTIAGAPARQLIGSGKEADDSDPGNAEVVLFKLGDKFFAACVHGEGAAPDLHRPFMMAAIQTVKAP